MRIKLNDDADDVFLYQHALIVCVLGTPQFAIAADLPPEPGRIEPDRRDFTTGTGIVPLGAVQVESGATWERGDSQRQITVGEITLRLPLTSLVELHVGLPSYLMTHQSDRKTGFDDAALEARWKFYHSDRVDFALQVMTTLPTGSRGVAERDWQPGAVLASSVKITDSVNWVVSVGGNRATAEGRRFSQAVAASSFRIDLASHWNLFAEAYVFNREAAQGPSHRYVDVGTVYFLDKATALDARIGKGVQNDGDIDAFASAGWSHRF